MLAQKYADQKKMKATKDVGQKNGIKNLSTKKDAAKKDTNRKISRPKKIQAQ